MVTKMQLLERLAKTLRAREITLLEETLWLDPIPGDLRRKAMERLAAGNAEGWLALARNVDGLDLVLNNPYYLKDRGLYEHAIIQAFISIPTNHHSFPVDVLQSLFNNADRARLQAAGDPLPGEGPFTIYRGVAGVGPARRVKGMSWTASQDIAWWFATRFAGVQPDPSVYRVKVEKRDILFYYNQRKEQEFVVMLPKNATPVRVERI